ncbi:unnamed protein product [Didymodactylos carnosus]|uniref:BED-type domain-containing protein n=1 Tax=Didymodactylos carnosus TaxID=1234261 RepID=A0A813QV12_9BILA|nr:unnamed protein product [Didymodactylos carnosus]CAF1214963.1 unnamed protein product [Didymodactylos carnosus]CAF3554266.1 unnamed protein product [Didymodactylos carnosus]CAF4023601.1 unnamed protein product [Didymodactylos carnosus]
MSSNPAVASFSTITTIQKTTNIPETARDKFFTNGEKGRSAKCVLCGETVKGNLGVTSNYSRHVEKEHGIEFQLSN